MSSLESLPTGLHDMYAWTLRRIVAQPPEEALLAQRVLLWLTYSEATLQMADLQRALATSYDTEGGGYDPESITPAEIILTACCGLVSTGSARSDAGEASQAEVKLIR